MRFPTTTKWQPRHRFYGHTNGDRGTVGTPLCRLDNFPSKIFPPFSPVQKMGRGCMGVGGLAGRESWASPCSQIVVRTLLDGPKEWSIIEMQVIFVLCPCVVLWHFVCCHAVAGIHVFSKTYAYQICMYIRSITCMHACIHLHKYVRTYTQTRSPTHITEAWEKK